MKFAGVGCEQILKEPTMAFSRFRVRSPERDRETDLDRMRRLRQVFRDICVEMEREREGLRDRYEKVTADAAFSQLALEDDYASAGLSSKIDDMTDTMIHYTKRIASLDAQIEFVTELDSRVELFSQQNTGDKAPA
jgi:hypothetical protein